MERQKITSVVMFLLLRTLSRRLMRKFWGPSIRISKLSEINMNQSTVKLPHETKVSTPLILQFFISTIKVHTYQNNKKILGQFPNTKKYCAKKSPSLKPRFFKLKHYKIFGMISMCLEIHFRHSATF